MNNYAEIIKTISEFDEIPYYAPNGGNLGDALIACNEFQFFKDHKIEYRDIRELDYSRPYCLIHGGGGAFVPYYTYAQQLPKYLTDRNLKKCVILPQSFYECQFILDVLDERFTVFCRDRQSYDYCVKSNKKAKFILCGDMAFLYHIESLNIDDIVDQVRSNQTFGPIVRKIEEYFRLNTSNTANFIRNDLESITTPEIKLPNFDLSKLFFFSPAYDQQIAIICSALFIYAIRHYDVIITNRLHVAIASFLMNKKIELYDNSYNKVKNIYELSMSGKPNKITTHFRQRIDADTLIRNSFALTVYEDRIGALKSIFDYFGLNTPKIFNGFKNKDILKLFDGQYAARDGNAYKCSLGHAAIVKAAKALDLPFVCVFEDDVYPINDIRTKLDFYLSDIPDDADIIMLGWSHMPIMPVKCSEQLSRQAATMFGSHAYIIFKRAYNKYIQFYDENPQVPSDQILFKFGAAVYVTNKCLFIQHNSRLSNYGFCGYIFEMNHIQYQTELPPPDFTDITKIPGIFDILNPVFNSDFISCIQSTINNCGLNKLTDKKKCIIIDRDPDVKKYMYGNSIDNSDAFIIRINQQPEEEYIQNYGRRTDMFFGNEGCREILKNVCNKILIPYDGIKKISSYFNIQNKTTLTTGFICVLIFMRVFDTVQIFGFKNPLNLQNDTSHDIEYEQRLLNELEKIGKIKRFEP